MVGEALEHFRRVDVLVNAAGGWRAGKPVHETPLDTLDFLLNLNTRSVFISSRAVAPSMLDRGSGKIVNVAARAALGAAARNGAYSASKSAVVRLTETMAAELKKRGDQRQFGFCPAPSTPRRTASRCPRPTTAAGCRPRPSPT